jgi:hypothetical protein
MLRKPADGAPVPISPESCASAAGSAAAGRLNSDRKAAGASPAANPTTGPIQNYSGSSQRHGASFRGTLGFDNESMLSKKHEGWNGGRSWCIPIPQAPGSS